LNRGLRASEQLISGEGVTLNAMLAGEMSRKTIAKILSDGDSHKRLKRLRPR